ncbi:MAG: helix-turn-helix transcriptional regulator [Alphaproteobacteria bacterium]|nr:helix-turn-helix transcriptional regulator [Alphaproteobacteria bacterium]MBU0794375.1 helix-turn-helix transcriptional regulator [Alphaproteobacteria bacterium]MBU0875087.1 helix-turn-helix transcriptional regulator [Alphaproteobacteria bacterium]MBU1768836.1 helix-turn-helix transcriptional regulator [Alphaproteobacteria bacterium]
MDMTTTRLIVTSPQECMRITETLSRFGDRWTLPVVVSLHDGTLRFNQIRREVSGISQQMLTRTLRALERDGMVSRTVHPTTPPKVDYTLTPLGQSLAGEAVRLGIWAQTHREEIDAHRERFDREQES